MVHFGPLANGMIVEYKSLIPLIRFTAMNSRQALLNKSFRMSYPLYERKKAILEIYKNYK